MACPDASEQRQQHARQASKDRLKAEAVVLKALEKERNRPKTPKTRHEILAAAQAEYNRAREQQRPRKRVSKRVVRSAAEIAAVRQGLEAAQEKRQQVERDEKYRAPTADDLVAFIRVFIVVVALVVVFGM
jgi:hypothetical protein